VPKRLVKVANNRHEYILEYKSEVVVAIASVTRIGVRVIKNTHGMYLICFTNCDTSQVYTSHSHEESFASSDSFP
jgi:hypothetical protein